MTVVAIASKFLKLQILRVTLLCIGVASTRTVDQIPTLELR
jgi:hypothetical protein